MNKLLLLFVLTLSLSSFGQVTDNKTPVLASSVEAEQRDFKARKSHWLTTFGFEQIKYDLPYNFQGERKNFTPGQKELYGAKIGIGGELYIGKGLMTASRIDGYYLGTLFSKRLSANPDYDIDYAYYKTTGQVMGLDASQTLSYLFDMKTKNPILEEWSYLTVEPFVEASIGVAQAYNRAAYSYDTTGPSAGGIEESYRHTVKDQLAVSRLSVGINFVSNQGFFLNLKASQVNMTATSRKESITEQPNGGSTTSDSSSAKNVHLKPAVVYLIGGGYKF
ncbi:MAG: hypothetical protein AB7I27_06805 [Bacteriovoracaceae bacterium]